MSKTVAPSSPAQRAYKRLAMRRWRKENWAHNVRAVASSRRQQRQKRGLKGHPVEITAEEILELFRRQKGQCYWFQIPIDTEGGKGQLYRPSLDRIDNRKGYTKENVVLSCRAANLGRSNSSPAEWSQMIRAIRAARV